MVIGFWQDIDDSEIQYLITDDLEEAKQIIQSLADYDQTPYVYEVYESMRWSVIQADPKLPDDERMAVSYAYDCVPAFDVVPNMKEGQ